SVIVNCDTSSFVNGREKEYYPGSFKAYRTMEQVYIDLHQDYSEIDWKYLTDCEMNYGKPKSLHELLMSHQEINVGGRFPNATPLPHPNVKIRYLQLTFRWAEKLIEEIKPDVVITLERNYYVKNMIFQICKRKNIPFMTLIS